MWKVEKLVSKGNYNYAVVKGHPNATKHGYVLHHRIVVENKLRRLLRSDEIVHHKNHDKKDNTIDNLEVLTASEHSKLHNTTGRSMVELQCPECEDSFERERRQTHLVKGGKRTFCSRICNGRFNRRIQLNK